MSNGTDDNVLLYDDPSADTTETGDIVWQDANQDSTLTGSQSWLDQAGKIAQVAGGTIGGILNAQRYGAPYPYGQQPRGVTYGRGPGGSSLTFGQGSGSMGIILLLLALLFFGRKLFRS
jgi:hypothetical protein